MQRSVQSRASRRENDRVVFERLWRGTFQAVSARRGRASSLEAPPPPPDPAPPAPPTPPAPPLAQLEPALRSLLASLRPPCCCRCACSSTERPLSDELQVCLSNEERKSMRSVIRCALFIDLLLHIPKYM